MPTTIPTTIRSQAASALGGTTEDLKATSKGSVNMGARTAPQKIIDIRRSLVEMNLKEEIISMFNPAKGPRKLPTLLLYNEEGLQIFEDITYLEEYYLTDYEIEVLRQSATDMADKIPSDSMVIELGSGNLRKVCLLLQALDDAGKSIEYYALDLSERELERTLAQVPSFQRVTCHGLLGTFEDGREWLKQPKILDKPKCILYLGSSIGNFDRHEAGWFLRGFADVLRPSDTMLIGLDACSDAAKVYHAYNDSQGLTHRFVLNGLANANNLLGSRAFDESKWRVIGEYVYDDEGGRHQAFLSPIEDVTVLGTRLQAHERIQIEQSLKYSRQEADMLWSMAGVVEIGHWSRGNEYGLHLLEKPSLPFGLIPSVYAASPLPSLADWEAVWHAWDIVTKGMLPAEVLLEKPIRLRNACIFYLGHIPTFLDIQLTRTTGGVATEPRYFWEIFERGIDPDVDNPEHCHAHSDIPEEWPPVAEIERYQQQVRARLRHMYGNDGAVKDEMSRKVRRGIWVGFEHEVMHLETLLYMMLQSDRTLPPPLSPRPVPGPDFKKMARLARAAAVANEWHTVPAQTITIGIDDPETGNDVDKEFGWDNECPSRRETVHSFQAKSRPITNEEYAAFVYNTRTEKIPASWASTAKDHHEIGSKANGVANGSFHTNGSQRNGSSSHHINGTTYANRGETCTGKVFVPDYFLEDKAVRTVYGFVPLQHALDWPVFASYDELARCAAWMGGRIPTFEEARSLYAYVEERKKEQAEKKLGRTLPAVNGHLLNGGVEETPPSSSSSSAVVVDDGSSSELFIDLDGANVGFQHWHPTPVTAYGNRLAGQSELGGVWEWTSTSLRKFEGFEPLSLYPGYTADFFDGKHNIVLGGSWATHPRIAGRKSFVNWYQRNYPYAWIGARLVRDI